MSSSIFVRFPRTPHLAWLGNEPPRDDKLFSPAERDTFLDGEVLIEEKVDGANLGLSVDESGRLVAQNRGAFLGSVVHPQFAPLARWLGPRREALTTALGPNLILFGEWCDAVHSVRYNRLPDWFLAFDVFDRSAGAFWSTPRRDDLCRQLGLMIAPQIGRGTFTLRELERLIGESHLGAERAEGLYLRRENETSLLSRAKLVSPAFTQAIGDHWSGRALSRNSLLPPSGD